MNTRNSGLGRRDAVSAILAARGDALVVTGLGSPSWDVAACGDAGENFYLWGGMGGAGMVGLGLALAQPTRRVVVVTGDGEMLMGLGSLATIAARSPANLAVVVLDNERYGETGMQRTHTAAGVDLVAMAAAAGWGEAVTIDSAARLKDGVRLLYAGKGPIFAAIKVKADRQPGVLPPRDGTYLLRRFRHSLLGSSANG